MHIFPHNQSSTSISPKLLKPFCYQAQLACACPERAIFIPIPQKKDTALLNHISTKRQPALAPIGLLHHNHPISPLTKKHPILPYRPALQNSSNHFATKRNLLALAPIGFFISSHFYSLNHSSAKYGASHTCPERASPLSPPLQKNTPYIVLPCKTSQTLLPTNAIYRICPCASRATFIQLQRTQLLSPPSPKHALRVFAPPGHFHHTPHLPISLNSLFLISPTSSSNHFATKRNLLALAPKGHST